MPAPFDTIPPESAPEYVRPPSDAYDVLGDTEYHRHQAVNHVVAQRLIERITGRGEDQRTLYGISPDDQYFAGSLASQYRYREAQRDDDTFQNIASNVAPFSIGLKFQLPSDSEEFTLSIEPRSRVFYRRFPTYSEQIEHGELAGVEPEGAGPESPDRNARADGGSVVEGQSFDKDQDLLSVYERLDPGFDTLEISCEEIREAAEAGEPVEFSLDGALRDAREEMREDDRVYRAVASGVARSDREEVPPETLDDRESFDRHIAGTSSEDVASAAWTAAIRIRAREQPDGRLAVTVTLVNTHGEDFEATEKPSGDWQSHLFDAGLTVEGPEGQFLPFESEKIRDEYQYDGRIYALGENCAVDRSVDGGQIAISTTTVPVYRQPNYVSRETVSAPFEELAEGDVDAILGRIESEMQRAEEQYESTREEILRGKSDEAAERFDDALDSFVTERERFHRGRELLQSDDRAMEAFRATNQTFANLGPEYEEWRLFQIIYIVMALVDVVAQTDPDRGLDDWLDVGDVIYFPTGGGKTEAYLGLVVFTAFHDRLRGKEFGTTAWTKFPLRLLSLQQLQRIADVLGQAELIRRNDDDMGGEEFSVGYFVGSNNTPNKVVAEQDGKTKNNVRAAMEDDESKQSWLTIPECPYCGEESVEVNGDLDRLRIVHQCTNADCPEVRRSDGESAELPVYITDQEIYRYAPTFVVSTIDKIAVVGMQRRIRPLFGRLKYRCPDHGFTGEEKCLADEYAIPAEYECDSERLEPVDSVDPPSILIQDELHLLREEFGAFDSHYETFIQEWLDRVVDGGWDTKVVAATATIAGAEDQVRSLYWKDASVYPSQGPRLRQSFYAYEDPYKLGRQMIGAIPRGVSRTFAIDTVMKEHARVIQEFGADLDEFHERLLNVGDGVVAAPLDLPEGEERDVVLTDLLDQYAVQIGYCISKNDSDLLQRTIETMINRQLDAQGDEYRRLNSVTMTGETEMETVRDTLATLEADDPSDPIDAIVATSMISHGVDVDKFNFISFFGMPRNTAEYIQAYSRVGRKTPGTVFVLFNAMQARDRSHYSRFEHYHRYQDLLVEATPLERWAEFAIECTLPGIFAGIVIQYYDSLLEGEYPKRVYMHAGLQEAVRNDDIDKQEMLDFVMRAYRVEEDQERAWSDTTGMRLYREKIESQFDELWKRVMEQPSDPKRDWIGFLLDREDEHRGPMRSLRDIDEQVPIFPGADSASLVEKFSKR